MVAPNIKAIRDAAMKLSPQERASLAEELYVSIDPATQVEIDQSWADEGERRLDAFERGEGEAMDGDSIMRSLEEGRTP